jgi:hypothetical protein
MNRKHSKIVLIRITNKRNRTLNYLIAFVFKIRMKRVKSKYRLVINKVNKERKD